MISSENRYPLFGIMREKGRDLKHGKRERAMREGALMPRGGGGARFGAALVPTAAAVDDRDHGQHDRDLDQDPDHGCQGGARIEAEQADGRGDGQLEEVAGANQGGRSGDTMLFARQPVEQISEAGVEIDLDQNRYREQADN